jgi:hypothetical protein
MIGSTQRALAFRMLLTAFVGAAVYAGAQSGRPIKYSEPRTERGNTNAEAILPGRTRLDQWESDLNRPFDTLFSGKSLDGMVMPAPVPPPPVNLGGRSKEKEEKAREWLFMKPEELQPLKGMEAPYRTPELAPDGRKLDDLRPMERRYLEFVRERDGGSTNRAPNANGSRPTGLNPYGTLPNPNSALLGTPPEYDQGLRRMFGWDDASDARRAPVADDLFSLGAGSKPFTKFTDAEIQRREEYMRILDYNNSRPADAGKVANAFATKYVDSSFYDPPKPPAAPAPAVTGLGGGLNGGTVGLGGSSWTPAMTPPPPPKPQPAPAPPSPFMTIPRRGF